MHAGSYALVTTRINIGLTITASESILILNGGVGKYDIFQDKGRCRHS